MRTLDVCLSPDLMHLYPVEDCTVVVVDILRATSCITTAVAHGVESVTPFSNLDACKSMSSQGYITAGERNGEKVEGFDLGNSPFEYMEDTLRGQRIAFTTTNGTHAIERSKGAEEIIIGSFLNQSAVVDHLRGKDSNILVVCAGWKGKVNLEDTLYAGMLVEKLKDDLEPACDAPLMAHHLYREGCADMVGFLKNSSHVKRLGRLNIKDDIAFCLTPDQYIVVPKLTNGAITL